MSVLTEATVKNLTYKDIHQVKFFIYQQDEYFPRGAHGLVREANPACSRI